MAVTPTDSMQPIDRLSAYSPIEEVTWAAAEQRAAQVSASQRRTKGVVHTPPAVARAVAAGVDRRLRETLGLPAGLADSRVTLVDPACGMGAFVAAALGVCRGRSGSPRVLAHEADASALSHARRLLEPVLREAGWRHQFAEVDTLTVDPRSLPDGPQSVVVVLGNPPWSTAARAAGRRDTGFDLADLMRDFHHLPDGSRLRERKSGVLSDQYVRFMRWSVAALEAARFGVLGLVTNGSFLDGPVHRAMRAAMLARVSDLEVLDLGGSALLARAGRRDDNVFCVRPSVAVTLASRAPSRERSGGLRYRRVWGTRAEKLEALARWGTGTTSDPLLVPAPPFYPFVPRRAPAAGYLAFTSLAHAMPFHREGVQTNRDGAVIAESRERLLARLRVFVAGETEPALLPAERASGHYDPERARAAVAAALDRDPNGQLGLSVRPLSYRPGDDRVFCPVTPFCHRPRPALLSAMEHASWALVTVRKDRGERPWRHVGAVDRVADSSYLSTRSSCRTRVFPETGPDGKPNLDPGVARVWLERTGERLSPAAFMCFVLAVLSAPAYQARHDTALRVDYPRVPIGAEQAVVGPLMTAGARVRDALLAGERDQLSRVIAELDALLPATWL